MIIAGVNASLRQQERFDDWLGTMQGKEPEDPTRFGLIKPKDGKPGKSADHAASHSSSSWSSYSNSSKLQTPNATPDCCHKVDDCQLTPQLRAFEIATLTGK